jgi:hypothetical protein
LWGIGALFSNSLAGMPFILYDEVRKQRERGNRVRAAWYLLLSVFFTGLWIGLVAYCGYRAYLAIP